MTPFETAPSASEVASVLAERAVRRAVLLAVRDARIRAAFVGRPGSAEARIEALTGPHLDVDGRPYYLSTERVRGIIYGKRRRGREHNEHEAG